jgi:ribose transport system substrate-binding protein
MVDNRRDPKAAVKNAERLVREHVDLADEFQIDGRTVPAVASKFRSAGIPLIAIDVPHPGAIYFGADNYAGGIIAGRQLGQFAKHQWRGSIDEIILLEILGAGPLIRMRTNAMLDGINQSISASKKWWVVRLDGKGEFRAALMCVRKYLRTAGHKQILVGAANDPMALGALRAFQECGQSANCAVVGQNAEPEARAELRQPGTHFIGSVAYFPGRYGEMVIRLATDVLLGKNVPPATFTPHQLVTPQNVNRLYPNDSLFPRLAREYN